MGMLLIKSQKKVAAASFLYATHCCKSLHASPLISHIVAHIVPILYVIFMKFNLRFYYTQLMVNFLINLCLV